MDAADGRWACPNCWVVNQAEDARCRKCGKTHPKPSESGRLLTRTLIYVGATVLGIAVGLVVAILVGPDLGHLDCNDILKLEPGPSTMVWVVIGGLAVATVALWQRYRPVAWCLALAAITLIVFGGPALAIYGCSIG